MPVAALQALNQKVRVRTAKGRELVVAVRNSLVQSLGMDVSLTPTMNSLAFTYAGLRMCVRIEIPEAGIDIAATSNIKFCTLSYDQVPVETVILTYTFDDNGNTKNASGTPYTQAQFPDQFVADAFAANLTLRP